MVALIPARGGSKGIPGKNLRPFCGKPLLYWACLAAHECTAIDEVYVATDSPEIAAAIEAFQLPGVRSIDRAAHTATDTASTESVLLDFAERVDFTHIVLIQATSPLVAAEDLAQGCARIAAGDCDSIISVVRQKRFHWAEQPDGAVLPINYDPLHRPRRQDFAGQLVENGAFYITSRTRLLETGCRISGRIASVEMPEASYFELDERHDWTILEGLKRALDDNPLPPSRDIQMVATDVDGCLTDAGMYYAESGDEWKKFSTRDGLGFRLLQDAGLHTCIITQENTRMVERRAQKLRVPELHQGIMDKAAVLAESLEKRGLSWAQLAYLGDDLGDLEVLRRAGFSACPADAVPEIRSVVQRVLTSPGGAGAFREFAELILSAR